MHIDRYDEHSPYDPYDPESTFYQEDENIQLFHQPTLSGFETRWNEGFQDLDTLEESDYVLNEDGTFRFKTPMEMFFRDYKIPLFIVSSVLLFNFV